MDAAPVAQPAAALGPSSASFQLHPLHPRQSRRSLKLKQRSRRLMLPSFKRSRLFAVEVEVVADRDSAVADAVVPRPLRI